MTYHVTVAVRGHEHGGFVVDVESMEQVEAIQADIVELGMILGDVDKYQLRRVTES